MKQSYRLVGCLRQMLGLETAYCLSRVAYGCVYNGELHVRQGLISLMMQLCGAGLQMYGRWVCICTQCKGGQDPQSEQYWLSLMSMGVRTCWDAVQIVLVISLPTAWSVVGLQLSVDLKELGLLVADRLWVCKWQTESQCGRLWVCRWQAGP